MARDRAYIDARFRGGAALGIRLRFAAPETLCLAEAGAEKNAELLLIPRPFFIYGVDLTRFLQRAMQHRGALVNMTSVVGAEGDTSKDGFSHYAYRSVPLYFLPASLAAKETGCARLRACLTAPELTGSYILEPMDKGFLVSELQTETDAERVSALVGLIQELGGYLVCCPLEIAWRRGMLDGETMRREAGAFPEYREYIAHL